MTTANETYRLFVNDDRTVMVRIWWDDDSTLEVATRSHPDAVWGPPVLLEEEK